MLRFAAVVLAVSALTLGLAAAASPPPVEKAAPLLRSKSPLDPVWAKQLTPKLDKALPKSEIKAIEPPPNFAAIKRMTLDQKGIVLQASPERVTGPIKLTARAPFHDEQHFVEFESNAAKLVVRMKMNYAYFWGPEELFRSVFTQPRAVIHFVSQPGRRYLLECAVDIANAQGGTITGSVDGGATYSVSSADRATLLIRVDGKQAAQEEKVRLAGDQSWYFDGCELSWTGP